jgi:hypothetical protein
MTFQCAFWTAIALLIGGTLIFIGLLAFDKELTP